MNVLTLPVRVLAFALWFAVAVVRSSWAVLSDILTPGMNSTSRVVRLPLDSRRDFHAATLGILITLTPGTLTLGVSADPETGARTLLVHSMYHPDAASALADLRDMEHRMLHALTLGGRR